MMNSASSTSPAPSAQPLTASPSMAVISAKTFTASPLDATSGANMKMDSALSAARLASSPATALTSNAPGASSVRHCEFYSNHGDGLGLRGWDGFLLDNWFSGNGRAGFAARQQNASVTFTANRIEWNAEENMIIDSADGYHGSTGNFFDRAGSTGLAIRSSRNPATQITITGNFFKRAGKNASSTPLNAANMLLDGAEGVTCVGNTFQAGRDDGPKGAWGPAYGIIYRGLRNCVVRNNVLHDGATKELFLDQGGHHEGVIISDNPGRLFTDFNRSW